MSDLNLISKVLQEIKNKFPHAKNVTCYVDFSTGNIFLESDTGEKIPTKSVLIKTLLKPKIIKYLKSVGVNCVVLEYLKINITINPDSTKLVVYHSDPKLKINYSNEIILN